MLPAAAQAMNMSAKLFKNQSNDLAYARFVLPELGDDGAPAHGVSHFSFPSFGGEPAHAEESAFHQPAPQPAMSLSHAEAQAANIIREAEENASLIEQAAHDRGLSQAEAKISAQVAAQVADLREQLAATIAEVANLYGAIAAQAERELIELAIEIAKKVVHREVTIDREVALTLARVTLGRLDSRAVAALHLHPDDCAYVSTHLDKLGFHGTIELVEDRSITAGGCLVRTENGDVDARVDQLFDEISRGMLGKK